MRRNQSSGRFVYRPPPLYPAQRAAIFARERYAVIEASTKVGKTYGSMAWLLEKALRGKAGQNFWWVAPILEQARIPYRRMKSGLPQSIYQANETRLTLELLNGTTIWFKGGDHPDSLFGDDVNAAVLDEASRMKEEVWHAVRSTLTATQGPIRIIGNVKGRKNWAYRLARRAEAGEPGWHYARLTAFNAVQGGILSADEVEDARRSLPEHVFKELYLAEPSDDGGNPFGLDAIRACIGPLSPAPPAVWGIDLAKSQDWTVAIALDAARRVCRLERWQAPWQRTIPRICELVGYTPALVDATGVGDPVLEALQAGGQMNFEGFTFTPGSKQQLMEGLALAIQQQTVVFPDGPLVAELEEFEYIYTRTGVRYCAPEGLHDDCVVALALAVHAAQRTVQPVPVLSMRVVSGWGFGRGQGPRHSIIRSDPLSLMDLLP